MQTFIVRVWTPADGHSAPPTGLHGKVSHVESGHAGSFADGEQLLAFLTTASPGGARVEGEALAADAESGAREL